MEDLAPPHQLVLDLISSLEGGESLRNGLTRFSKRSSGDLNLFVTRWQRAFEQGHNLGDRLDSLASPYQRAVIRIAEEGLRGASVLDRLQELERELGYASAGQIEKYLQLLPIKILIPVLIFMFPGFLLLLIGPLVLSLLEAL